MRTGPTPDEVDITTARAIAVAVVALVTVGLLGYAVGRTIEWLAQL